MAGFKNYVRQNITVGVAQTVRVDIALEVGAATESVTVTEQTSLLKTESGELSHTVEAQRLIDLGLLGIGGTFSSSQGLRFYMTEIQLIPGASAPGTGFTSGARVNGAPNGTQRTTIDGMDGTNQINAVQAGTGTSVDAIQETAIQTSNFAAEFGQVGGGLFNITMRSGTNQYHGGGYDYLMNEAFNAATPFVNKLPKIRRNDYGYSLGGPVWIPKVYNGKDKTFFFYDKEQFREFFSVNDTPITVPTGRLPRRKFRHGAHGPQSGYGSSGQHDCRRNDLRSSDRSHRGWSAGSDPICRQRDPVGPVRQGFGRDPGADSQPDGSHPSYDQLSAELPDGSRYHQRVREDRSPDKL